MSNLIHMRYARVGALYRLHRHSDPTMYNPLRSVAGYEDVIFCRWSWFGGDGFEQPTHVEYGGIVMITKKLPSSTQVIHGDEVVWIDNYDWVECEEITQLE